MSQGLVLSLKLGKTRRRTISFSFGSVGSPLYYVQVSTNSFKMLNLHGTNTFV